MAGSTDAQRLAGKIVEGLRREYPDVECALHHDDAFQLLIATILSAQCTDERVNQVTPALFAKYPTAADLAAVPLPTLEKAIQSTGFFRNKARNIQACCQQLVERHGGQIPQDLEALVQLPGVGRKTANVVLGTAYRLATGVVVDTHVTRLSNRMGLTTETDAVKIEQDLIKLLPQDEWIDFSHRMIHHGRRVCGARKPNCDSCVLAELCPRVGVEPAQTKSRRQPAAPSAARQTRTAKASGSSKTSLKSAAQPKKSRAKRASRRSSS